jgi:spore coat polysaccharide biosynthesis predicted glycosyltransferase SpsG
MGGSDLNDLTPTVLRAFDGFDLRVDAIVGPGFSAEQEGEIHAAAGNVSADVTVKRDPDDLAERMFEADFAVSTSSSTTYELLALGTPIVSQPVAYNQEPIASVLRERDAAIVLEHGAGVHAFRRAIEKYVTNATLRRERHERGRNLVDGRGTERVARKLLNFV